MKKILGLENVVLTKEGALIKNGDEKRMNLFQEFGSCNLKLVLIEQCKLETWDPNFNKCFLTKLLEEARHYKMFFAEKKCSCHHWPFN